MSDTTPPPFDGVFDESLFAAEDATPVPPSTADIERMLAEGTDGPISGHVEVGKQRPRFDGDTSELSPEACWTLQELIAEPHVSEVKSTKQWAVMRRYEDQIRSRLSELGLLLEINRERGFAFTYPADDPSPHSRKLLRVRTLSLAASALALYLYNQYLLAPDDPVVEMSDMVDHMQSYKPAGTTDGANFDKKIYKAIESLREAGIIRPIVGTDRFIIYAVITSVLSAERVGALEARYRAIAAGTPITAEDRHGADAGAALDLTTYDEDGDLENGDE